MPDAHMIPAEQFAALTRRPTASVIEDVRAGRLVGRVSGDHWIVAADGRSAGVPAFNPMEARCTGCHYPLVGVTDSRCPECGHRFDPSDVASVLNRTVKPPGEHWKRRRHAFASWGMVLAPIACVALMLLVAELAGENLSLDLLALPVLLTFLVTSPLGPVLAAGGVVFGLRHRDGATLTRPHRQRPDAGGAADVSGELLNGRMDVGDSRPAAPDMTTVILLPGLDGTGRPLEPFVAAAPPAMACRVATYPADPAPS